MIHRGRVLAFAGSAALHVGALAALLLFALSAPPPEPLFVDLTGGAQAGDERPAPPAPTRRARETGPAAGREAKRANERSAPVPLPERPVETSPAPAPLLPASSEPARIDPPTESTGERRPAAPAPAPETRPGHGVASDAPAGPGPPRSTGGGSRLALAGPDAGRGEVPAEFGPYLAAFRQRIQELVVYPLAARRRGLAGRVEVEVLLEPTGRVRDVTVVASSSHSLLDEAAVEAVRSSRPVPLPENLPRRPLRVRLPVVFDLR